MCVCFLLLLLLYIFVVFEIGPCICSVGVPQTRLACLTCRDSVVGKVFAGKGEDRDLDSQHTYMPHIFSPGAEDAEANQRHQISEVQVHFSESPTRKVGEVV